MAPVHRMESSQPVLLYCERPITELTREELIEAIHHVVNELRDERAFNKMTLDILTPRPWTGGTIEKK